MLARTVFLVGLLALTPSLRADPAADLAATKAAMAKLKEEKVAVDKENAALRAEVEKLKKRLAEFSVNLIQAMGLKLTEVTGDTLVDAEAVLSKLPKDMIPKTSDGWAEANRWLQDNFMGKTLAFTGGVSRALGPASIAGRKGNFVLHSLAVKPGKFGDAHYKVEVNLVVDKEWSAAMNAVGKESPVLVVGTVANIMLFQYGEGAPWMFSVQLNEATIGTVKKP